MKREGKRLDSPAKQRKQDRSVIDHLVREIAQQQQCGVSARSRDADANVRAAPRRRFGEQQGRVLQEALRKEDRPFRGGLSDF